jgi:hypothetical protein
VNEIVGGIDVLEGAFKRWFVEHVAPDYLGRFREAFDEILGPPGKTADMVASPI